jgi:peptidyl-prolyl cis-trans isomerase B (cyclophilin B)
MSAGGRGTRIGMAIARGRRLALFTLVVLAAVAIFATLAVDESSQAAAVSTGGCKMVSGPRRHADLHRHRPPQTVSRRDRLVAIVKTNCGHFEIQLDARRAPRIVNSFVYLARSGFYDGLLFYRVVPNFVVQGGDPRDNGTGGPGYRVTEPPPAGFHYRIGTVAMAKNSEERPGAAGSVFFIVTGQGRYIKDEYAILGRVQAGLATVKRIAALGTESEHPSQMIRIDSIRIRHGR